LASTVSGQDRNSASATAVLHESLESESYVDAKPENFIDKIKRLGTNAILGQFVTNGVRFDSVLDGMTVSRIDTAAGIVEVDLTVGEKHANAYGTLHGGATSTLVDIVGTLALLTKDPLRAGVSVELSASFMSAAKIGTKIRCIGRVRKAGRRLGFTTVEIYSLDPSDKIDKLVAEGRHTKAL